MHIDMIVEIPYNSFIKYEYDKKIDKMRCDRILHTAMTYPGNYGYIPQTLAGDGDPLDILLVSDYQIFPGTVINVKIIGILFTTDEKGEDNKIIAVPSFNIDPNFDNIKTIKDLPKRSLSKIKHFFQHYKDTEKNKWVEVGKFGNLELAKLEYEKCYQVSK